MDVRLGDIKSAQSGAGSSLDRAERDLLELVSIGDDQGKFKTKAGLLQLKRAYFHRRKQRFAK